MNDIEGHMIFEMTVDLGKEEVVEPPPPVPSSVLPWWVNHKWDADECMCVRCGIYMRLLRDCEWDDDEAFNVCRVCSLELLKECMAKLNTELRSGL